MESQSGSIAGHIGTYHGDSVRVEESPSKGRILRAAREFEAGERILIEYPLVQAVADRDEAAWEELKRLHRDGALQLPPLFYWCALHTLTQTEVQGAAFRWPAVPLQIQDQVMQLHAPEEDCREPSPSVLALLEAFWPKGGGPDAMRFERILQSWIYNSFDLSTEEDDREAGVVYLTAAMMSHSCSPNAAWHLDDAHSYTLIARSFVAEDEEVTIPYLGPADLCLPTPDRRAILQATKAFLCGCERCSAPLDAARAFRCPRCGGAALGASEPGDAPETLSCASCGALDAAEAAPLLAAERRLRPWARSRAEFHAAADLEPSELTAADALADASSCLVASSWILDAARAAVAEGAADAERVELLRARVDAHAAAGPHMVTRLARLRLEFGEALRRRGDEASLREAKAAFGEAAEALALLFGDDHPEHREAAKLCDSAQREAQACRRRAEAPDGEDEKKRPFGSNSKAKDVRGKLPGQKRGNREKPRR